MWRLVGWGGPQRQRALGLWPTIGTLCNCTAAPALQGAGGDPCKLCSMHCWHGMCAPAPCDARVRAGPFARASTRPFQRPVCCTACTVRAPQLITAFVPLLASRHGVLIACRRHTVCGTEGEGGRWEGRRGAVRGRACGGRGFARCRTLLLCPCAAGCAWRGGACVLPLAAWRFAVWCLLPLNCRPARAASFLLVVCGGSGGQAVGSGEKRRPERARARQLRVALGQLADGRVAGVCGFAHARGAHAVVLLQLVMGPCTCFAPGVT